MRIEMRQVQAHIEFELVVLRLHARAQRIESLVVLAHAKVREFVHDDHPQEILGRLAEQRRDADLALGLQSATLHARHRGVRAQGIADHVQVNVADIRQQSTMNYLVRDRDVIFSLAGQVSHIDSMRDPFTDLEINCRSQLTVLEACRNHNPRVKVVYAGTRQVYGRPDSLPVSETHLVRPTDVNGINKVAGEYYHLVYNNVFGVRGCSLRLTNVYGPRQLIRHNRQGFIAWFIRLAIGHYRGRMTEVARRLGIGRSTLYRKLTELGIDNAA